MKMLTVYIDFKSAASYLALDATIKLITKHNLEVKWLPYQVRSAKLADQKDVETKTETHLRVRETQRRLTDQKYAAIQGIPMSFQAEPKGSSIALMALLQLTLNPLDYVKSAFVAYWRDGLDLDEVAVVRSILIASGCDADNVNFEDEGQSLLAAHQTQAEEQGVFDAPMFVIGEARFLGREHLPWMEALFTETLYT